MSADFYCSFFLFYVCLIEFSIWSVVFSVAAMAVFLLAIRRWNSFFGGGVDRIFLMASAE